MAKRKFQDFRFRAETLAQIEQANEIIEEYQDQNLKLTLRQLYYQFVARDLIANTKESYKALASVINDARLAGMVDWDAIEDRRRMPDIQPQFDSLGDLIETAINWYRLPRWAGQDSYVELWVEKRALASVLEPIASEFHVTLQVNEGYGSASALYYAARRFIQHCEETSEEYGERERARRPRPYVGEAQFGEGADIVHLVREPILLYIGDHDPSGEDMVRDIRNRFQRFGIEPEVEKLALTTDQVREFRPPENPVKLTDSRAEGYIRRHGRHCWEVDALPPNVLARIIRAKLRSIVDRRKMREIIAREDRHKERLREATAEIAAEDE